MASVKFKRGLRSDQSSTLEDGALYFAKDEHVIYMDDNTTRHKFATIGELATRQDLANITVAAGTNPMYYLTDENILCYFDGTVWKQINAQSSASGTVWGQF